MGIETTKTARKTSQQSIFSGSKMHFAGLEVRKCRWKSSEPIASFVFFTTLSTVAGVPASFVFLFYSRLCFLQPPSKVTFEEL